jgi:hypothetical protein
MRRPVRAGASVEPAASGGVVMWRTIESAPRDGEIILVNDTTGLTRWCAAKWLDGEEWQGWMYDDEISNDSNPCGPQPTHWIRIESLSTDELDGLGYNETPTPDAPVKESDE